MEIYEISREIFRESSKLYTCKFCLLKKLGKKVGLLCIFFQLSAIVGA